MFMKIEETNENIKLELCFYIVFCCFWRMYWIIPPIKRIKILIMWAITLFLMTLPLVMSEFYHIISSGSGARSIATG